MQESEYFTNWKSSETLLWSWVAIDAAVSCETCVCHKFLEQFCFFENSRRRFDQCICVKNIWYILSYIVCIWSAFFCALRAPSVVLEPIGRNFLEKSLKRSRRAHKFFLNTHTYTHTGEIQTRHAARPALARPSPLIIFVPCRPATIWRKNWNKLTKIQNLKLWYVRGRR